VNLAAHFCDDFCADVGASFGGGVKAVACVGNSLPGALCRDGYVTAELRAVWIAAFDLDDVAYHTADVGDSIAPQNKS